MPEKLKIEISKKDMVSLILSAREKNETVGSAVNRYLRLLGISPEESKEISLMASAKDYYDRSQFLQQIPGKFLDDSFVLIECLENHRAELSQGNKSISLSYLVEALWIGRNMPDSKYKQVSFDVGAAEYYRNNPLLQYIPHDVLKDYSKLITYLVTYRDQMAKVDKKRNSLGYLVQALVMGGKIPREKSKKLNFIASAAEYVFERKDMVKEEMKRAYAELTHKQKNSARIITYLWRNIDRAIFTYLNDDSIEVSSRYFRNIMKFAMEIYGDEILRGTDKQQNPTGRRQNI